MGSEKVISPAFYWYRIVNTNEYNAKALPGVLGTVWGGECAVRVNLIIRYSVAIGVNVKTADLKIPM